uniref:Mitochondria-eating protein n=1 Tax=Scophthalmus maximus TaxID=52904 RepID=A0A8D3BQG1_SCOMX
MADTLRRLTNTSSFSVLQDKLEIWHRDYHVISCDQNLNRCCELIELTAKIQGQLFAILNLTAAEGGHYAGVDTLKTRLLPWLGTCFSMSKPSVTDDTSLQLIQDRRIRELSASHGNDMQKMETQLCSTRMQLDSVRAEYVTEKAMLQERYPHRPSATLQILYIHAHHHHDTEQYLIIKCLSVSVPSLLLSFRLVRSRSPSPLPRLSRSSSPMRSESPTRAQLTNSSRHARLVSRFSDLYAVERLEAQSLLRRYITDLEMVQKIIFIAVVESFKTAKLAYRQFKLRVRKTLSPSHFGPESLEDAAVDYIVRNLDLYDVQDSVNGVINAMNVNPRISFPPEVDFVLISALIRETCRVAFAMQTLDPALDLAFTSDGELYNDHKYRRSYDSEFTAPLVMYHVWPALVEGNAVIVKGEALTSRGAPWSRSQSRSRSASPVRSRCSLSPTRSLVSLYNI